MEWFTPLLWKLLSISDEVVWGRPLGVPRMDGEAAGSGFRNVEGQG